MTQADVRDLVIDWLHQNAPNLPCDDLFPEGLIFLCNRVCSEAERAERRKLIEADGRPRTFEMN